MKENFTPGPWRVRKIAEFDIYKNASLFVLANDDGIIKMGKDAKAVASMPNLHHYPDEVKTIYANAYLIAAAPDMYDALSEAVEMYGKPGGPWNVPGDLGSWIEKAKAALKKTRVEE